LGRGREDFSRREREEGCDQRTGSEEIRAELPLTIRERTERCASG
jgi:hypothetical protein